MKYRTNGHSGFGGGRLMAAWRTKAYDEFGLKPGSYSHASGKVHLLADLAVLARAALRDGDDVLLARILGYVRWAASQRNAGGLASAVDLAFFLPLFRDPGSSALLRGRLPDQLLSEKWDLL